MSEPMSDGSSTSAAGTGGGDTTGAGGGAAGNATTILVLGIVGILCCNFLGPIAWYMGKQELQGITEGRIRASNEGTARAGMILGIIGTAFLVLGLLWLFFFGGMAILGAVLEQ